MKLFSCDTCQQLLFFESVQCTGCGRALAYLPDRELVSTIDPEKQPARDDQDRGTSSVQAVRVIARAAGGETYRLCRNFTDHAVCNWAVPVDEADAYCRACRLNQMIPNLNDSRAKAEWHRLEVAKRRLLYTLFRLRLPIESKAQNPEGGLAFSFMQDDPADHERRVFTGHRDGVITINIAEADDPFREKMRVQMGEAYRTLLGHFRHEIGHYYWERLIRHGEGLAEFRARFGDERDDYAQAQQLHYGQGPLPDWQTRFISAYASTHPWEDWAETWAHYLHMVDTLDTALAYGLSLQASPDAEAASFSTLAARGLELHSFEDLMSNWFPLTVALNSLSRSMGENDFYPFVLSDAAIEKLRFVHQAIKRIGDKAS